MPTLERLVYCSMATVPTDNLLGIAEILAVSERNNARDGLTGALAISEGWFLQVVEGEASRLDALMRRLQADPRHKDIEILERRPIAARLFGDWSMQSARIDPSISEDLKRVVDKCREQPGDAVAALLKLVTERAGR